jgi:hypothetical protein
LTHCKHFGLVTESWRRGAPAARRRREVEKPIVRRANDVAMMRRGHLSGVAVVPIQCRSARTTMGRSLGARRRGIRRGARNAVAVSTIAHGARPVHTPQLRIAGARFIRAWPVLMATALGSGAWPPRMAGSRAPLRVAGSPIGADR